MNSESYLIIGGAEKAGTTSLFSYLAAHPAVCASSEKETDYFRSEVHDLRGYQAFFTCTCPEKKILMEASPGYLAEAINVAPRIARLLPDARLVFVARDPVERLVSSFRFYKSRLHIPESMSFDAFVQACFSYHYGRQGAQEIGLLDWHLNALGRGRFEQQIAEFERALPSEQLLVLRYEQLRDDVRGTVKQVATFSGLDPSFYDTYVFGRENVTFLAKRRTVQRIAIFVNDNFQAFWRNKPRLKQRLLRIYKRFNEQPAAPDQLEDETRRQLRDFYGPTYRYLATLKKLSM